MDPEIRGLVERLHAAPTRAVVTVAGGGVQAIAWLLGVPGASRTVLEVSIPYASTSFAEFLGYEPEQSVSAGTAEDMARLAYQRAVHLRDAGFPVAGVGCTATIATDRVKRGEHRCHVAAWRDDQMLTYGLQLVKGLRDRQGEDKIVSRLVLRALAEISNVTDHLSLGLEEREAVKVSGVRYEDAIKALLAEHVSTVTVHPDGTTVADEPVRGGVLPGSFDPLHQGHDRLAAVASDMLKSDVTFELSITNVDKPPLEEAEIRRRLARAGRTRPVVLTRAPRFYQKARLFPGCTFVIGWDTAVRLVDPRYYGGEAPTILSALEEIRGLGCRFLVAGRLEGPTFRTLADVAVPQGLEDIFTALPEAAFRYDVSSTELRLAARG